MCINRIHIAGIALVLLAIGTYSTLVYAVNLYASEDVAFSCIFDFYGFITYTYAIETRIHFL